MDGNPIIFENGVEIAAAGGFKVLKRNLRSISAAILPIVSIGRRLGKAKRPGKFGVASQLSNFPADHQRNWTFRFGWRRQFRSVETNAK